MGWHSTVNITRDVAKALYIQTYMNSGTNFSRDIPDSVLETFLDEILYDSGYNAYVVDNAASGEEWMDGDHILEYSRVREKVKELGWKSSQLNSTGINEDALEIAAKKLFDYGIRHGWWPYSSSQTFDGAFRHDSIAKSEFLDMVWDVVEAYNQNS